MAADSTEPVRRSGHSEEGRAFLQQRVALFWKVGFLICVCVDAIGLILAPASFVQTGAILNRDSHVLAATIAPATGARWTTSAPSRGVSTARHRGLPP